MEQISFDKLLRYGLPGGLCIAVALFVYSDLRPMADTKEGLFGATILFGLALLIGALIQGLHRAILYPVIVRFIHAYVAERDNLHVGAARMTFYEKWTIDRLTTVVFKSPMRCRTFEEAKIRTPSGLPDGRIKPTSFGQAPGQYLPGCFFH